MEEITWLIYKMLTKEVSPKSLRKAITSSLFVLLFFMVGWLLQNKLGFKVSDNSKELFSVIAQSLVALVALVGVMIAFGFEGIRIRYSGSASQSKEQIKSDADGWKLGLDKFLKFAVYSFFVVVFNLFFVVFSPLDHKFALAILFSDIALTSYSFFFEKIGGLQIEKRYNSC